MKTLMKPLTHLLSPLYLLAWLFSVSLFSTTHAADLKFDPATPIVEINQTITLSVSGTVGQVRWIAFDGKIEGNGTQVTYFAPAQVGKDTVTVKDSVGSATVDVIITPPNVFSSENASWEIFTNRSRINASLLSEDSKTLWVGTVGGLEKRDAQTGKIQRVLLNTDGLLPGNDVSSLLSDGQGGLWVGTGGGGLARYTAQGEWQVFNEKNSGLPSNWVKSLLSDGQGGLWVGTGWGLARYTAQGEWQVFNTENSGLPDNDVESLLSDGQGGLWIGTWFGGLAHYTAQGDWQVLNKENSGLPSNWVKSLLSDGQGGLWVGTKTFETWGGGLVRYTAKGEWQVFNTENSGLPDNDVESLLSDGQGGLWVGTWNLARYTAQGEWQVFNTENSGLPDNSVNFLLSDGLGGLWIGTWFGRLAHYTAQGEWQVFNTENSGLPDNEVNSLLNDGQSGLWVGTSLGGLARYTAQGKWQVFNIENSGLPDNFVNSLLSDGLGGLWIGTWYGGLARYTAKGELQVFNTENSGLPDNHVQSLLSDGLSGLWVGIGCEWDDNECVRGGLARYTAQGEWQVFNTENSGLPNNSVKSLLSDGQGGLWVGTGWGLARYTAQGEWQVFNTENSGLPDNSVNSLLSDGQGGLWVGTYDGGLARYTAKGEWQVFNTENSGLPSNSVNSLLSDGQGGGLWIGTWSGGLARYTAQGEWQVFDIGNSDLPDNFVNFILSDGQNGLWIGTWGGLAHLTFGKLTSLLKDITDPDIIKTILSDKHAAIIIAAKGKRDMIWDTTKAVTGSIYKMLYDKGFLNSQIYYLSPEEEIDFNHDTYPDKIIDAPHPGRPLKVTDVEETFRWATQRGKLDQPLYFFFVDHGDSNSKLTLSQEESLEATKLKELLDNYQTTTGNEVILVIDACYSGIFLDGLIDHRFKRAIISSSDGFAYPFMGESFSSYLANHLGGKNFLEAYKAACKDLPKLMGDFNRYYNTEKVQIPRFEDGSQGEWLKQVYINGNFKVEGSSLAVQELTTSTTLSANQSLPLTVEANFNPDRKLETADRVTRVWAVVRPPKMDLVTGVNGTPIVTFDYVPLSRSKEIKNRWQTNWNKGIYNGNYEISFYAEDDKSNITSSNSIIVTVQNGTDPPPQANVQIQVEKDRYQRGETLNATMVQQLGWGYDLYVAVTLPPQGEQYVLLNNTNKFVSPATTLPWVLQGRAENQTIPIAKDFKLPADLPTGQYCLWAILSPQDEEVYETRKQGLWVVGEPKCFEVF